MQTCRIDGCDKEAGLPGTAKGLCRSHYKRDYRYGDPETPLKRVNTPPGVTCECGDKVYVNGMCEKHNAAASRAANPVPHQTANQRFRARARAAQEKIAGRPRPTACELCGEAGDRICWDHDHATGKFRGWLCDRCNRTLGQVKDNPTLLRQMAIYLESASQDDNGETYGSQEEAS